MNGLPLDPDWPGLDSDDERIRFHSDGMRAVADRLQLELEGIRNPGAGSLDDLGNSTACLGVLAFGDWDVAQDVSQFSSNASEALYTVYSGLANQLANAITAIHQSADNYDAAEEATVRRPSADDGRHDADRNGG